MADALWVGLQKGKTRLSARAPDGGHRGHLHLSSGARGALGQRAPGSWREVVTLSYFEVTWQGWDVPAFGVPPERAAWRRRKWWGPVSPRPVHLDGAITTAGAYVLSWHYGRLGRRGRFEVANDGGVCEPALWLGDQA